MKLIEHILSKFHKTETVNSHWIAKEGYEAAKADIAMTDNPYCGGSIEYDDWNLGWSKYHQWHRTKV